MKDPSTRMLLFLLACLTLVLHQGCASGPKAAGASADAPPNGELRAMGQAACQEVHTGKIWQVGKSRILSSQQDAEQYAANLQLAGYADWRLPTKEELYNLHYMFFWKRNSDCAMNSDGEFWTESEDGEQSLGHWETDYLCGPIFKYVESTRTEGRVRAIRP